MFNLIKFLLMAVGISLSGVMAPGPITAATLAAGARSKHAGIFIAIGHGIIELPLMILIMVGMSGLLKSESVKIAIGLVGGLILIHMGIHMIRQLNKSSDPAGKYATMNPLWIGIILSGSNPYFLIWWASVGLNLTIKAMEFGAVAFAIFALVHWLCDLVWLVVLSFAGHKGSKALRPKSQRVVLAGCSLVLLVFGVVFIYDAAKNWLI